MRSRLFWRRSAAAAGTYASAALGFGATVVALHVFPTETFGLYALVLAMTAFVQSLLDLTVEEALVKFGFRYTTREDWGRLRRLFESAVAFKLAGGVLATALLLAVAPFADTLLNKNGLTKPLLIGAFCKDWRLGVGLAVLPIFPALLIASNTVLAPTNTIVPPQPAKGTQPAVPYPTSHFGPPFWLDPARLTPLLFALAFFALLGWLGWVIGSFFRDA